MSWTKRQLLDQAFAEIAMANWQFDLDPEDINYALNRMDAMIASWGTSGARIGYALSDSPTGSDPDQASGIAQDAVLCVVSNLAVSIAPKFGKVVSPDTKNTAKTTKDALMARCAEIIPMQFDKTLPTGAGNKPWRGGVNQEFFQPTDNVTVGHDAELDI